MRSGIASLLVLVIATFSAPAISQNHQLDPAPASSTSPTPTSVAAGQASPTPTPTVTIDFTGRLMGYFRVPDKQPFKVDANNSADWPCPALPANDASPEAKIFLEQYPEGKTVVGDSQGSNSKLKPDVLVGMGDNFSPNYFSRAFFDADLASQNNKVKPKYQGKLVEKDFWDWDATQHEWLSYDANRIGNDNDAKHRRALDLLIARGKETVGTDNVACFLARAHYAAVVPGPHDFYFGAERLRELARFMATVNQKDYQPVQMLAANLAIQTSWADDHKPLPDQMKHKLNFLTRYIGVDANHNVQIQSFTENGSVYPWMRSVKIQIEPPRADLSWGTDADFAPVLCQAQDGDPDDFVGHCSVKLSAKAATSEKTSETVPYELPKDTVLEPGKNYAFCFPHLPGNGSDKRMYCSRFAVLKPFFQTPAGGDGNSTLGSCSQIGALVSHGATYNDPLPYKVIDPPAHGKTVVIFGVVDPALRTRIGGLNFAWRNVKSGKGGEDGLISDDHYKTEVLATDPAKALEQLQQCFDQEHSDLKRSDTIRVLLAQMTPAAAAALSSSLPPHLQFDVVISGADDLLATPNQTVSISRPLPQSEKDRDDAIMGLPKKQSPSEAPADESSPDLSFAPYIAVPPTHSTSHRAVRKRTLTIRLDGDKWTFNTSGEYQKVSPGASPNDGREFWQAVGNSLKSTVDTADPKSMTAAIQALTLAAMQRETEADVAMLQQRDFYSGALQDYLAERCSSGCSLLNLQEILDRFIWKGDALVVRGLTGGVLKKVLEQSKKLDQEEKSSLASFPERQRGLVYVGIHHDDVGDFWMVNDVPLDEGKLYLVAMSDYIALGDTGFPDLAQTPIGDVAEPPSRDKAIRTLSGLVCNNMRNTATAVNRITVNCLPFIDPKVYYDQVANVAPPDPRQGQTTLAQLSLWGYFHPRNGEGLSPGQKKVVKDFHSRDFLQNVDQAIQDRSAWMLSLDKAAIGFSGLWHIDDEATVQQQFGGIRNPQVTAKRFHSWDTDVKDQLIRYQPNLDLFITNTLRYSSKFTGNPNGVRTIDQPADTIALDGGTYLHPLKKKLLPQLEWLASAHFETQPFTPYASVTINPLTLTSSSSTTLTFAPDRSFLVLARTGPHWQDRKSYIEMGTEGGANLDAITAFSFVNPGAAAIPPCALTATQTLGKCVNNFNKNNPGNAITPATRVLTNVALRSRYGLFWNSHIVVPFQSHLSYTMDNSGDFFFNSSGDNSTDVRFRHQVDQAVKFFVFPNLDFEPTYTIFLFENKVDQNFLFQQQFAVKINYAFSWTNARDRKQQFEYQKPQNK